MALCRCELPRQVKRIGHWDGCPLQNGGHTSFIVNRCQICHGVSFFPQINADIALRHGTKETKEKLNQIINEDCDEQACRCQACGRLFKVDLLVPDDLWKRIKPEGRPEGGGLLCGICIVTRIEELGQFAAYNIIHVVQEHLSQSVKR